MSKTFIPYGDKIVIRPIEQKKIIHADEQKFEEMGEVLSVGEAVSFVKPGDIVFFVSHACWKTPKEEDGTQHWVISSGEEFILGKYVSEQ